jgi:potassium-dependent mechanosensitive channel
MRRLSIACVFLFICFGVIARPEHPGATAADNRQKTDKTASEREQIKISSAAGTVRRSTRKNLIMAKDTLTTSDYMMSIDRVNDDLNSIRDSSALGFEVVRLGRKIEGIESDISIIRKNVRGRGSTFSIKNQYLYQNFISDLNKENDRIEEHVAKMYHRVYNAKLRLRTVLSDSVFRVMYADDSLRNSFDRKLVRLERKWSRTDSTAKANVDTLNVMKMRIADNAVNLSNMLNIMDVRLDKADRQLLGPEVKFLWQKAENDTTARRLSAVAVSRLNSEKNAIGYYFSRTSQNRAFIIILAILLFIWLYYKRKLLNAIREPGSPAGFLHLHYLNNYPVLSVLVLLLSLMPLFDAYAPTPYIAIEYFLLLIFSTVILSKKEERPFLLYWLSLVTLLIADTLTYLFAEPTFLSRIWMLALQAAIILFTFLFLRNLNRDREYYKRTKSALITGMLLSGLAILSDIFGRYSLSGILGLSAIFAVTQVIILPVFVETIIEIILLQLQSSRMKKGFNKPFDRAIIEKRIKLPLVIIAIILWFIMLTSNLDIYHGITNAVTNLLTATRSIGSVSFKLISVLLFFVIVWFAHILQRLISFLFGETGIDTEDIPAVSKKQHSRLLITRLLVLTGGYLLAITATGLPLDKITILLGALGIGIGMGLQNVVNNFVSGIILIFDGSLQIGDEIEVSGQAGRVKEIGLRASTLNTADGAEVIIPNGNILSQNIVNWTFSNDQKRIALWFILSGKELDSNVINEVINNTISKMADVISEKKPVILYTRVTSETCTLNIRFWSTIKRAEHVKSEALLQLSAAFARENIQLV